VKTLAFLLRRRSNTAIYSLCPYEQNTHKVLSVILTSASVQIRLCDACAKALAEVIKAQVQ
jgi:hypothetical protein